MKNASDKIHYSLVSDLKLEGPSFLDIILKRMPQKEVVDRPSLSNHNDY